MSEKVCIVTGGRGFLGRYLVDTLLEKGEWIVRILDIAPNLILSAEEESGFLKNALSEGRATYISADLRDYESVSKACSGASVVFHMASPNPSVNDFNLHYSVNVNGTRNIINACVENGVEKLIYTSSASVVFNGLEDIKNGDESLPYPENPMDSYSDTKAQAESLILSANGKADKDGRRILATCALRPSGIFGPKDPVFLPTTVKKASEGKLKYLIGDGENMMDFTYVENVVHAHICAEKALTSVDCEAAGKAYFITNGEPKKFWEFIYSMITPLGYPGPSGKIPVGLVMPLAELSATIFEKLRGWGLDVGYPEFSPSRLRIVSRWRTFNPSRASQLLHYSPLYSLSRGVEKTIEEANNFRREMFLAREEASKASSTFFALGAAQTAKVLLWRDVKLSFSMFLLLYFTVTFLSSPNFFFVSFFSLFLFVLLISLFVYIRARPFLLKFGYSAPDLSDSWQISHATVLSFSKKFCLFWNSYIHSPFHRMFVQKDIKFLLMFLCSFVVIRLFSEVLHTKSLLQWTIIFLFLIPKCIECFELRSGKQSNHFFASLLRLEKKTN